MRSTAFVLSLVVLVATAGAQSQEQKQLTEFRAGYASAKRTLAARPKDPKARAAFAVAGDRLATATMTAESLPRRTKYVDALRIYREVLKVDPNNHEAKNNAGMIVSIYKSMHRPIPN